MKEVPQLSPDGLSLRLFNWYAKSSVAVEHDDAALDFRDLPTEVSRHEAFPEQVHTVWFSMQDCPRLVPVR